MSGWRATRAACLLLLIGAAASAGCRTRLLETISPPGFEPYDPDAERLDGGAPFDGPTVSASCRQNRVTGKIDLLFVIDNSSSMRYMQAELQRRFSDFAHALERLVLSGTDINLHVGVITTDTGAGPTSTPNCDPFPGGQRGALQAMGQASPPGCFGPAVVPFVEIFATSYVDDGGTVGISVPDGGTNVPVGQSLADTFTCMASVGAKGCGFEHVLESTRLALTTDIPRNRGFLRDDALLAIVFLTNEDDCSAPPDTDLFGDDNASYGLPLSYRCTRFGTVCGTPPSPPPYASSAGPLAECRPAPGGGKLYDVQRYIELFNQPREHGGLKGSGIDVVLVGITAPSEPFEVVLTDDQADDGSYHQCSRQSDAITPPCTPTLQHSCSGGFGFFGDPAVRLNRVISAAPFHRLYSVCDGDYGAAFAGLSDLLLNHLGECCVGGKLPAKGKLPDTGATRCVVEDITWLDDGTRIARPMPRCGEWGSYPCWRIEVRDRCATSSPQSFAVVVDRGWWSSDTPPNTAARATCETIR